MPLILAVDTSAEHGSLALVRGSEVVDEIGLYHPEGHSRILFGELEALLARTGIRVADVDCFAAASGPGSFTGVRIGLSCVKGLAEATGRPAFGISNLQAMARCGSAPLRATVIDARREQIYGAVYDAAGRLVSPEVVTGWEAWRASLPAQVEEFVSTMALDVPRLVRPPEAMARLIADAAREGLERGERPDPAGLDANYVRRSDAELFWRE